ncbi:putative CUB and sushi domain-containing protein 3 [Hibiscus syriacus]|uniref:CUB and sushi domain-containing protein 3 n=1 Tax=Hibiscus syriacus TaxID=106335 RepID=A0A6A3B074_HIBSY|nr:putative CUB and sushi domain-containing protein 3 [Hibiscus syriacus]
MVGVGLANTIPGSPRNPPPSHGRLPEPTQKFIVGGSQYWKFGVNYTDWSLKTAPFYYNDSSVSLLPNLKSFLNCDLKKSKMIANQTQGAGNGFHFVLKMKKKPYYFVCAERNGFHCKVGLMKFAVAPLHRHQRRY